ncbi:hypothetical protein HanIR_Chr09g0391981 [Helianthus annuus]|nr:hypothetical protein HanIR_Chr09g0391981 [Helianthus annuus]
MEAAALTCVLGVTRRIEEDPFACREGFKSLKLRVEDWKPRRLSGSSLHHSGSLFFVSYSFNYVSHN